jgi:DNA mismatch repair protein MSH4
MLIDSETARNLELASNVAHKRSAHSLLGLDHSVQCMAHLTLLRLLNHTFTPMATRLLRMNILAPVTGILTITVVTGAE